jgi:poly-gamma-glutamate capsule biosynthesis protein CapA/YwtB (metallophosphatase superfamily)
MSRRPVSPDLARLPTMCRRAVTVSLLVVLIVLAACRQGAAQPQPVTPAVHATNPGTGEPPGSETATVQVPQTPGPLQLPTARPTSLVSPTTVPALSPPVVVSAPDFWHEALQASIGPLAESDGGFAWQLVREGAPADIRLLPDAEGIAAGDRPIVLAVPFGTDWHNTTLTDAVKVLGEGHVLAVPVDWSNLTPDMRALRIDSFHPTEPGYPLKQAWSLHAEDGSADAAQVLGEAMQAVSPFSIVHLAAVGDVMLDRALGNAIRQGNLAYPFERVQTQLQAADLTVGNLESALGDIGQPAQKRYTFRAPPEAALALAQGGFDIVSLANNHAMDYGPEALLQGINLLRAAGVSPVGAGMNAAEARRPVFADAGGLLIAFLAYVNVPVEASSGFDTARWTATDDSPGLAWADPVDIEADVRQAAARADLVVVLLHSGYEYVEEPSEPQVAAAQAAIDAGADLVVGHHAHVLQGVRFYGGGVIAYGLGNFAFEIDGDPATAILNVWLDRDGVRQVEYVPAIIQFGGQPRIAESWEAGPIRQRVLFLSAILNAGQ